MNDVGNRQRQLCRAHAMLASLQKGPDTWDSTSCFMVLVCSSQFVSCVALGVFAPRWASRCCCVLAGDQLVAGWLWQVTGSLKFGLARNMVVARLVRLNDCRGHLRPAANRLSKE
jgi:hypothetical protein